MQELQANTEVKVRIGPFVDVGDGFTPETGITLGAADEAELLKHNGAATVSLAAATWAAIAGCDGWYDLTLTASHTDTEGMLTVVVQDASACLPVHCSFMVLAQAAWISKYTAKDTGFMDVNVKAVSEDTAAADNLEAACDNYSATRGLAGTALPDAAADAAGGLAISDTGGVDLDTLEANVTAILEDTGTTIPGTITTAQNDLDILTGADGATLATAQGNYAPAVAGDAMALVNDAITAAKYDETTAFPLASADSGATQVARVGADGDTLETLSDQIDGISAGSSPMLMQTTTIATLASQTSFTLTAGSADDDAYNGAYAVVVDSVTTEQKCICDITDYTGSSKTITLGSDPAIFTMAVGDTIHIISAAPGTTAPTAAAIRAEIDSNSTQLAAILADTDELQSDDYPTSIAALQTDLDTLTAGVNVTQIDGQATNGNNATLNLKQLNIVNSAGSAIIATSSGSNGHGMVLTGNGTGEGLSAQGGASGNGIQATGGATTGHGIAAFGGATIGTGLHCEGIAGGSSGGAFIGESTGHGITLNGGATGMGLNTSGGGTSGHGIRAVSTVGHGIYAMSADGDGMQLNGGTNGHGLECIKAGSGSDIDADELIAILADTNELQGDWTDAGRLDAILDAIVADTNELQTDDVPGLIAALSIPSAAAIRTEIDSNSTQLAAIVADTNELQTDLTNGGRLDLLIDAILADTNELQGDWANGGRLDLLVDAILADTNELQTDDVPGLIAALNDLSAANVNAEVLDVLTTDTFAEPAQGAPAATASLGYKIGFLYKLARNKIDDDGTTLNIYNDDAATVDHKATVSYSGGTATRGEIATGP